MKKLTGLFLVCMIQVATFAQAPVQLSYYLPDSFNYNPAIPVPAAVIGHQVGEWHVTHDKLVLYMKAMAAANPGRIKVAVTGTTYEGREQLLLTVTSAANHVRIEEIRQQHLALCDPAKSADMNISNMPAVLWMGYSIHGNESSGSNAALLAIYHLAAARGAQVDDLLSNTVILLDPSFNPDGLQRFSTWANQHKSKNLVTDPNSREFSEAWPGGRFNHYWFDLNRDWLPAVHRESQNRLKHYHAWRPNVLTDHHEMGGGSTFFFQPGVPSRVNPLTPDKNQQLTGEIGNYHARFLDRIGSLYYTKEGYDDYYYGKGSTFPDIHGGVGILFEQASSRGHAVETSNGLLTFPFTVRNQFVTTLSTMEAVRNMRLTLLQYQRDFYRQAVNEARAAGVKGYIYGDKDNLYNGESLTTMLQRHQVDVKLVDRDYTVDGMKFEKGKAFFVSTEQPQYRLIRTIFEKQLQYKDSLFYDVTSWTMPLALGIPYSGLNAAQTKEIAAAGSLSATAAKGTINATINDYAYLMEWRDFEAPRALYALQGKGVITRVATNTFTAAVAGKAKTFGMGTIIIPSQLQTMSKAEILKTLQAITEQYQVSITGIQTGLVAEGSDLGSNKTPTVSQPKVAMLVGTGVNATDAGEVWHLLDQRMDIPVTHLEINTFNRVDLKKYTTIIMVSGSQAGLNKDKLKSWISDGGVLIACEDAVSWCNTNGITKLNFKKLSAPIDSSKMLAYADKEQIDGAQRMTGAIFRASADLTHPLCYGFGQQYIDLFKTNDVFLQAPKNPFAAPVRYGQDPLQSGFITRQNYDGLKGTASVVVQTVGSGRVIHFADNPNFRAFWLGGMKMFMNAVFFGNMINAGSARADD